MPNAQRSMLNAAALIVAMMLSPAPASAQVDLTGTWQRVGQHDNGYSR